MNKRTLFIATAILIMALVTAGLALAGPPLQGPDGQDDTPVDASPVGQDLEGDDTTEYNLAPGYEIGGTGINAEPSGLMNYQGYLWQDGSPFDGSIPITFTFYNNPITGTTYWQEQQTVQVDNGLFNVLLGSVVPLDDEAVNFQNQLWLGIQPEGAFELTPRQPLATSAYAMNIMPGTTLVDENEGGPYGYSFYVVSDYHPAIFGSTYLTTGTGVHGIHARSAGTEPGVLGQSYSTDSYATAVVGRMAPSSPGAYSAGVRGISEGTGGNGIGVWGSQEGSGWGVYGTSVDGYAVFGSSQSSLGVYGRSISGTGVLGYTNGDDVYGVSGRTTGDSTSCPPGATECAAGVYGSSGGDSYGGFFYGELRSAIIGVVESDYYGLWVYSQLTPDGNGIYTNGESQFDDYVTFAAGKSGYVVDIALNDGTEALEKGDVVVISGYDAPAVGNVPVIRVRKADEANSSGVVGVVDVLYEPCVEESLEAGQACGGFEPGVTTIQPGEYLSVVTLGSYEMIKVDASSGAIQPGDLLAASSSAGYAMKASPLTVEGVSFHAPGTIIGKALGAWDEGIGFIPVFVSAR